MDVEYLLIFCLIYLIRFLRQKDQVRVRGLVFSVSHGIITMHGGQINLETEEGKYTRFTVTLPARNIPADFNKT